MAGHVESGCSEQLWWNAHPASDLDRFGLRRSEWPFRRCQHLRSCLAAAFGCPGGEITFPSHLRVTNACDWPGVNCAADQGAGALCDTSPLSLLCSNCNGDFDGCKSGHLLPIGVAGALVCAADDALAPVSPSPTSLQVQLATATFFYDGGGELTVGVSATPFDLFDRLLSGAPLPGIAVPEPPVGSEGLRIAAIRLTLAVSDGARIPDGQGGTSAVIPRSGKEDSGLDIDLLFTVPALLVPGGAVQALAQMDSSPAGWAALFQCPSGEATVLRRIRVTQPQ